MKCLQLIAWDPADTYKKNTSMDGFHHVRYDLFNNQANAFLKEWVLRLLCRQTYTAEFPGEWQSTV